MEAYHLSRPVNEALASAGRLENHLEDLEEELEGHEDVAESLMAEIEAIGEELDSIDEELGTARRGSSITGALGGYHTAPTADMLWQLERAREVLPGAVERLNALISTRMPALFDAVQAAGLRPDLGDPISIPGPPGS